MTLIIRSIVGEEATGWCCPQEHSSRHTLCRSEGLLAVLGGLKVSVVLAVGVVVGLGHSEIEEVLIVLVLNEALVAVCVEGIFCLFGTDINRFDILDGLVDHWYLLFNMLSSHRQDRLGSIVLFEHVFLVPFLLSTLLKLGFG